MSDDTRKTGKMDAVADLLGGGKVVAFRPEIAHAIGDPLATLLLCQLWWWINNFDAVLDAPSDGKGKLRQGAIGDCAISPSYNLLHERLAMTRDHIDTARKKLREKKVLIEEKSGLPARLWYRLDKDVLYCLLLEWLVQAGRISAPDKDAGTLQTERGDTDQGDNKDEGIPQPTAGKSHTQGRINPPPKAAAEPQAGVRDTHVHYKDSENRSECVKNNIEQVPAASPKTMPVATPTVVVSSRIFVSDDDLDPDDDTEEYDDADDYDDIDTGAEEIRAAINRSLGTASTSGGESQDKPGLIAQLIAKGISADRASDLVGDFSDRTKEQLEYLPYADNVRGEAGYLIRAIEGNYSPPPRWIAKQNAIERRRREQAQAEAKKLADDAKKTAAVRLAAQCDALWAEMSDEEKAMIEERVKDKLCENPVIRPHLGGQTGKFAELIINLTRTARSAILAEILEGKP